MIKVLCSITILVTNFVESEDTEQYIPMIVGTSDVQVLMISEKPHNENPSGEVLYQFEKGLIVLTPVAITAFARDTSFLYISTKSEIFAESEIHRCPFNWPSLDRRLCDTLYNYKLFFPSYRRDKYGCR